MSDKNVVIGEETGKGGGLKFECPVCKEENVGWPGSQSCYRCDTEVEVMDPADQESQGSGVIGAWTLDNADQH
jgi:hypothetical protein